ncbi:MAG: sulfotransferase [Kibdelosporangium sp.]
MDGLGTVESLHASASKITGLTDFGSGEYLEGLSVLLDSYTNEASLTEFGTRVQRAGLRSALVARLLSEAAWQANPSYSDVPISRPIFVTGLPRTGTTALHQLLAVDPANQGLELWLTDVPQPRPPRATWAENPVFQRIQSGYDKHHVEHPEFMGLHYITADQPEECWRLLRQSMLSVSFECLAYVPTYSQWLAGRDWTDAYRRHRRNLQLIGLPDAGRRWVLKNPSHLFALDALMTAYPDALVIQTHRRPRTIIASMCSLAEQATEGWSDVFRGDVIGRTQLELWARGLEQFTADRAKHDPAQFYDVQYEEFVSDPLKTVSDVYAHFGLDLSDPTREAMAAVHSSGDRRRSHKYSLSDFGLTAEQADARFATL